MKYPKHPEWITYRRQELREQYGVDLINNPSQSQRLIKAFLADMWKQPKTNNSNTKR